MIDGGVGASVQTTGWARCRRCLKHPVAVVWKFRRGGAGLPPETDAEDAKRHPRWRTMGYAHCACLTTDWMDVDLCRPDGLECLRRVWEAVEESGVDGVAVSPEEDCEE